MVSQFPTTELDLRIAGGHDWGGIAIAVAELEMPSVASDDSTSKTKLGLRSHTPTVVLQRQEVRMMRLREDSPHGVNRNTTLPLSKESSRGIQFPATVAMTSAGALGWGHGPSLVRSTNVTVRLPVSLNHTMSYLVTEHLAREQPMPVDAFAIASMQIHGMACVTARLGRGARAVRFAHGVLELEVTCSGLAAPNRWESLAGLSGKSGGIQASIIALQNITDDSSIDSKNLVQRGQVFEVRGSWQDGADALEDKAAATAVSTNASEPARSITAVTAWTCRSGANKGARATGSSDGLLFDLSGRHFRTVRSLDGDATGWDDLQLPAMLAQALDDVPGRHSPLLRVELSVPALFAPMTISDTVGNLIGDRNSSMWLTGRDASSRISIMHGQDVSNAIRSVSDGMVLVATIGGVPIRPLAIERNSMGAGGATCSELMS